MSAETKKAMEAAIEAHVQDELAGGFTTAYFMIAQTVAPHMSSAASGYYFEIPDTQPFALSLGLLEYSRVIIENNLTRTLGKEEF